MTGTAFAILAMFVFSSIIFFVLFYLHHGGEVVMTGLGREPLALPASGKQNLVVIAINDIKNANNDDDEHDISGQCTAVGSNK